MQKYFKAPSIDSTVPKNSDAMLQTIGKRE
jgi:hypothetical protein